MHYLDELLNDPQNDSKIHFCDEPTESCRFRYRSERLGTCKALCELRGNSSDVPKVELFLPPDACSLELHVSLVTEDDQPHFLDLYKAGARRGDVGLEFFENSNTCVINIQKARSPRNDSHIPIQIDLPCLGIGFITRKEKPSEISLDFYKKNKNSCKIKVVAYVNNNLYDVTSSSTIKNTQKYTIATYNYNFSDNILIIVLQNKVINLEQISVACVNSNNETIDCSIKHRFHQAVLEVQLSEFESSEIKVTVFKQGSNSLSDCAEFTVLVPDSPTTVRKRKRNIGPAIGGSEIKPETKKLIQDRIKERANAQSNQVSTTSRDSPSSSSQTFDFQNFFDSVTGSDTKVKIIGRPSSGFTLETDSASNISVPQLQTDSASNISVPQLETDSAPTKTVMKTPIEEMARPPKSQFIKSEPQTEEKCPPTINKEALHKELISKVRNRSMGLVYRMPHQIAFGIADATILEEFIYQVPFLLTVCDQQGDTPLHNALLKEQESAALRLLKAVIDKCPKYLNKENKAGHTPLILLPHVRSFETKDIAKLMLENGANLEAKDCYKNTVVHYAVRKEKIDLLKVLLEFAEKQNKCEVINEINFSHQAALHYAVLVNNEKMLRMLLEVPNIDCNVKNNKSHETPLHLAVLFGRLNLVKLLLEQKSVDVHAKDRVGRTVLRIAVQNKYSEIETLFRDLNVADEGPDSDDEDEDDFDFVDNDSSSMDDTEFELMDKSEAEDNEKQVDSTSLEKDTPVIAESTNQPVMSPTSSNFNQASIDSVEPNRTTRQMNQLQISGDPHSSFNDLMSKLSGFSEDLILEIARAFDLSQQEINLLEINHPCLKMFSKMAERRIKENSNELVRLEQIILNVHRNYIDNQKMDTT